MLVLVSKRRKNELLPQVPVLLFGYLLCESYRWCCVAAYVHLLRLLLLLLLLCLLLFLLLLLLLILLLLLLLLRFVLLLVRPLCLFASCHFRIVHIDSQPANN